MLARLTGSRLGIAKACGWAFRDDVKYPERPRGEDAEGGNTLHECIAAKVEEHHVLKMTGLTPKKLVIPPPELEDLFDQAMDHLNVHYPLEDVHAEVTFAWNPKTGKARELGRMLNRDYSYAEPGEICGTADYIAVMPEYVVVGDWKTWATSHVTPAAENAQLAFGAICAAQVYGKGNATVEIVGLEQNRCTIDSHSLRRLDFAVWDAAFRRIVESIPQATATPGGHCTWCPALGACPATEQVIPGAQLVHVPGKMPRWSTDALGFDNDVMMAMNLPALEKAVDAVKASLKARYPNGIELDNGKIWKPTKTQRKQFNKQKAIEILGPRADEAHYIVEVEQWRQVNKK